jgi:hypothetical protein
MFADTNTLNRSNVKVANLEGAEEELAAEGSPIRDCYLADLLCGQQQQSTCFYLNVA